MSDLTRRQVLTVAAAGACAACLKLDTVALGARDKRPPQEALDAGTIDDYTKPGLYDKFAKDHKIILSRLDDKLVAMSALCTHKYCTVRVEDDGLMCPCHKSYFASDGIPEKGPARVSLPRFGITKAADGKITVDPTKEYPERKWDDEGAFVKLEKA